MSNKLTPGSNMRWESSRMILPEHREAWLNHQKEATKTKKPFVDEQQWYEFEIILREAMEYEQQIKFTYWADGEFFTITGHCHYINHNQQQFHIVSVQADIHYLTFDSIVNMEHG